MPRIVILGAGFGGVYTAKKFLPYVKKGMIELTVINRTNYFLFTPLLHEAATGSLSLRSVAEPLREVFAGTDVRIVQGTVYGIDSQRRYVNVTRDEASMKISFDYLVIATGSETNYYGVIGAQKYSLPLKGLSDASRIRARVIDAFEKAILSKNRTERMRLLSFAVVGGGATGVELAAELAEFVSGMVKRYYSCTNGDIEYPRHCHPEEPTVTLVHAGKDVLEQFAPSLRKAAAKRLRKRGVILHLNSPVAEVTPHGLKISGNLSIPADTVIWTAGVKPHVPVFSDIEPILQGGRLALDGYFHIQGQERIFAIGDTAAYIDTDRFTKDSKNKPLPMLAQVAEAQSKIVAYNIIATLAGRPLRKLHYHSMGAMVSVGQWFAVGEIWSLNIAGRLTWWLWRIVYVFKFASWMKRFYIAFQWSIEVFYPRDITRPE